jgi:hypothetical protein
MSLNAFLDVTARIQVIYQDGYSINDGVLRQNLSDMLATKITFALLSPNRFAPLLNFLIPNIHQLPGPV